VALFVAVALLAAGLSGCASSARSASGPRITVVEHDFGLTVSPATVRAGTVTLHIENRGPSTHELNLDRTTLAPGSLPLLPNSLQVNEDSAALKSVDSIGDIRLRTTQNATVRLKPGRYVLYCNLEGHYLGGMHAELDVTA
jgi:uncharacterized cupredoxin-like copper-binding protein